MVSLRIPFLSQIGIQDSGFYNLFKGIGKKFSSKSNINDIKCILNFSLKSAYQI